MGYVVLPTPLVFTMFLGETIQCVRCGRPMMMVDCPLLGIDVKAVALGVDARSGF
jgi:hypothetical protein